MTAEEFLKILEGNKDLIAPERYEKLKREAGFMHPVALQVLAGRFKEARAEMGKIQDAEQAMALVFQEETTNIKAQKETLAAQISLSNIPQ